jgi:hypothetical protein
MLQPVPLQQDGGLTLQWAGSRSPPNRTAQIQTGRSSMGRNLAGRTPMGRNSMRTDPMAPSRSAGTAGSDTERSNAIANAGTGTNAEPAQRSPLTRDNGIRSSPHPRLVGRPQS